MLGNKLPWECSHSAIYNKSAEHQGCLRFIDSVLFTPWLDECVLSGRDLEVASNVTTKGKSAHETESHIPP